MKIDQKISCPKCSSKEILVGKKWCICDNCGERFLNETAENRQQLKLFFSYSHQEEKICQKIANVLKERGHTIWFDRDKIHPGDNWREEIAKGILSSNGVIAFLSKTSVRDPGVCLNELSIAIGVRGGNIKTVLLESEKSVAAPSSISHIQWLDMSDWKENEAKGEQVFEAWFQQKMNELILTIESAENHAFSGQISTIRESLPLINYDTSKQKTLLQQPFVGRKWLTKKIEEWLNDPDGNNICVLYGSPGIGKSAFAANYCHFNSRVIASVFCEYNKINFNKPQSVIQTLAYLLACRLPEYRVILADILNNTHNIGEYNASELFDLLLTIPLVQCSIDGTHETVCIVIDGLDECGDVNSNPLAEVLSQYTPRFPSWIRILITTRKVDSVKHTLCGLPFVDLCGDTAENLEDIKEYFTQQLTPYANTHKCPDNFVVLLAEKSCGIFLYAKIVSHAFLNGNMTLDSLDALPEGISGAFHKWFGWFFCDLKEYHKKYRLPIGVLASSPEPIPLKEYSRLFLWDENDLFDFLSRISILIQKNTNIFGEETVEFSHKYLKDWLDSESAGVYRSSHTAAFQYMGSVFYRYFAEKNNELTPYETLYMFSFLTKTQQNDLIANLTKTPEIYLKINDIGDNCMEKGYINKAWQYFCAAEKVASFFKKFSDTPDVQLMYSISKLKLAEVYYSHGNLKKAFDLYNDCYNIRLQLIKDRGNFNDRKCFGVSCEKLAESYLAIGNNEKAKELFLQGLNIREKLYKDRGEAEDCRNLGSNYLHLAELYEAEGESEKAAELFRLCLEIRRIQNAKRGSSIDMKDMVVILIRVASFELRLGHLKKTEQLIKETNAFIEPLAKEADNAEIMRAISFCYVYHGELLRTKGEIKKAEALYLKTIDLRKRLVADRGSKEDIWNLGGAYIILAALKFSNREYTEAKKIALKTLKLDEELVKERGKSEDQKGVFYCYLMLGKICFQIGETEEALMHFEKALPFAQELYNTRGTFDDREDYAFILHHLARAYYVFDEYKKAEEFCDKALMFRKYQVEQRGLCDDIKFYGASCLVKCQFHMMRCEYDQAEQILRKVFSDNKKNIEARGSASDYDCLCMSCIQLAEFYMIIKDVQMGIEYATQAISIANQLITTRNIGLDQEYKHRAASLLNSLKQLAGQS